ncbi:MAG: hypothetical protein AAFV93_26015, partial [Chloroflexota bacterium]
MDKLSKINWEIHGFPDLSVSIRKVTSKSEQERDEAYETLFQHYLRAITGVTPELIEYFISLLHEPEMLEKDRIIGVLTDFAFDAKTALKHEEYKAVSIATLLDIKKGQAIFRDIALCHNDEETRF